MRRSDRHRPHAPERERTEIAQVAARLLIDGEADDFASAKRRAAAQVGVADSRALPDNREIQAAIIEHQRLFDAAATAARTRRLRETALRAMRFFAEFEPRLVGPVLHGTPFEHTPVTLHLFADEPERVIRRLLDARVPYHLAEQSRRVGKRELETYPMLETAMGDCDFELVVMPHLRLNHPPLSPLDGAPYRRLDAAALGTLLDSLEAGEPWPTPAR
jgi:hypothetical protein